MALKDGLLREFDYEMLSTRATLERVPEDKFEWTPHPKSFTMGKLASHLADLPAWAEMTLKHDSLDLVPPGGKAYVMPESNSRAELLAAFDKNVAVGHAAIADTSDDAFHLPWSLLNGGKLIFSQPRIAVIRGFVMGHLIHHRAQLGVYLRLNDIPVPAVYGPSADEGEF